jgi:hypothetical protein
MRALLAGLVGFIVIASLTSCSSPGGAVDAVPPVGPPKYVAASCATPTTVQPSARATAPGLSGFTGSGGAIPDGFQPAWVLACPVEMQNLPGRGNWWVRLTERADLDPAQAKALLAQLRQPSQPHQPGEICTANLVQLPYYALVDARGTAVEPAIPTDSCDKPMDAVGNALQNLPYRQLSSTPERPVS